MKKKKGAKKEKKNKKQFREIWNERKSKLRKMDREMIGSFNVNFVFMGAHCEDRIHDLVIRVTEVISTRG